MRDDNGLVFRTEPPTQVPEGGYPKCHCFLRSGYYGRPMGAVPEEWIQNPGAVWHFFQALLYLNRFVTYEAYLSACVEIDMGLVSVNGSYVEHPMGVGAIESVAEQCWGKRDTWVPRERGRHSFRSDVPLKERQREAGRRTIGFINQGRKDRMEEIARQILDTIRCSPGMPIAEVASINGVSEKTVRRRIAESMSPKAEPAPVKIESPTVPQRTARDLTDAEIERLRRCWWETKSQARGEELQDRTLLSRAFLSEARGIVDAPDRAILDCIQVLDTRAPRVAKNVRVDITPEEAHRRWSEGCFGA